MKKIYLSIVILFVFLLTACANKEIMIYYDEDVDAFNSVLENVGNGKTKAYDLREYEECYASRIPGFYCSRVEEIEDETEELNKIIHNLVLLLGDKRNNMIILVDKDGINANYVATKLFEKGYKNIHYFANGFERYVELQDDFVPESGECDC